ncbi:DNA polymerase III subunit delta [Candidatus Liberibacter americanus]|uniref:DNA polymerase III delta subunit n=1 Tax=Candidatus Liberibacter americanus str. Sao Paulo TaxID=1261131 RepID=U6B3L0_9HYPH|nr:DNA polymerase III subunit delta [Candidatus Liberibacter americanus]AHA27525.1 DNA polymerase III delta subunit [Candidatus Liberibacter americanus str. Sao Paulo]EMS36513.1 DNA polymerase III subunit delta [Candidatus Liberibacter americanus PW_SP]
MVELKSYEFEKQNIDKLLLDYFVFIFYGSDKGLISELIIKLKKKLRYSYYDPFSFINLNCTVINKNPEKLWDEIQSIGLFNKKRVIFIDDISNEKTILDCLEEIIIKNINNVLIIIKSGELKKDNRLRKMGKIYKNALSISCYSDNEITLTRLIKEEFSYHKKQLSSEAEKLLLMFLGGDRIASRNELQKLFSYCLEEDIIKEKHIKKIISDTHNLYIEEIIDAAILGNTYKSIILVEKFFSSKMPIYALLHGFLRRFQLLYKIHIEIDSAGISPIKAIQKFEKTNIHKKTLLLEKSIQFWDKYNVRKFLYRIEQNIRLIREKRTIERIVVFQSILSISQTYNKK